MVDRAHVLLAVLLTSILAVLIPAMTFADESHQRDVRLVGNWVQDGGGSTFVFNADGTGEYQQVGMIDTFPDWYTIGGSKLVIPSNYSAMGSQKINYPTYTFKDGKLILRRFSGVKGWFNTVYLKVDELPVSTYRETLGGG